LHVACFDRMFLSSPTVDDLFNTVSLYDDAFGCAFVKKSVLVSLEITRKIIPQLLETFSRIVKEGGIELLFWEDHLFCHFLRVDLSESLIHKRRIDERRIDPHLFCHGPDDSAVEVVAKLSRHGGFEILTRESSSNPPKRSCHEAKPKA